MYPIIGLCGQAGSGKDTVADILIKNFGGDKIAFAAPLKRVASFFFPAECVNGNSEFRARPVSPFFDKLDEAVCSAMNIYDSSFRRREDASYELIQKWCIAMRAELAKRDGRMSTRYFLQQLGSFGRAINPDFWINRCIAQAEFAVSAGNGNFIVVSDVRYRNEALAIKKLGGVLVKIETESQGADTHSSEQELLTIPDFWFDKKIHNDKSSLETLAALVAKELDPNVIFR